MIDLSTACTRLVEAKKSSYFATELALVNLMETFAHLTTVNGECRQIVEGMKTNRPLFFMLDSIAFFDSMDMGSEAAICESCINMDTNKIKANMSHLIGHAPVGRLFESLGIKISGWNKEKGYSLIAKGDDGSIRYLVGNRLFESINGTMKQLPKGANVDFDHLQLCMKVYEMGGIDGKGMIDLGSGFEYKVTTKSMISEGATVDHKGQSSVCATVLGNPVMAALNLMETKYSAKHISTRFKRVVEGDDQQVDIMKSGDDYFINKIVDSQGINELDGPMTELDMGREMNNNYGISQEDIYGIVEMDDVIEIEEDAAVKKADDEIEDLEGALEVYNESGLIAESIKAYERLSVLKNRRAVLLSEDLGSHVSNACRNFKRKNNAGGVAHEEASKTWGTFLISMNENAQIVIESGNPRIMTEMIGFPSICSDLTIEKIEEELVATAENQGIVSDDAMRATYWDMISSGNDGQEARIRVAQDHNVSLGYVSSMIDDEDIDLEESKLGDAYRKAKDGVNRGVNKLSSIDNRVDNILSSVDESFVGIDPVSGFRIHKGSAAYRQ
jgi:hypothetical protein